MSSARKRLGVLASHPIQYQAPLFRELALHVDLRVYFAHRQTAQGQATAGFGVEFDWDVDLLGGYEHRFLQNRSRRPGVSDFFGCDTPAIADEIRDGKFDAFLVTGWYLKCYWQAIRACHRFNVPVMVRGDSQLGTPRGWLKKRVKEFIYPRLLQQFDAFLYVGRKNKLYLEHYGVTSERLFFSPHCIDNTGFASLAKKIDREQSRLRIGITPDQSAVLFIGKFLEIKRPLDMVLALRALRSRGMNVCGVFVGDGPLRVFLETFGRDSNVPLTFLGFRNQTELPEAYVIADVLLLPSESETWGLVVNEALACGTPVVVSDAAGCAPDLVIEGQTGSIFPKGDTAALADALHGVLTKPPPREAISRRIADYSVAAAARGVLEATVALGDRLPAGRIPRI